MRTINFKAWNKEERVFCRIISIDFESKLITVRFPELDSIEYDSEYNDVMELDEFELIQSTEQYDIHNNKLYEGDICLFTPMLVETLPTFKGVIEWDKYRFCIRNLDYEKYKQYATPYVNLDLFGINVKKIGNTYENPELLQ